MGKSGTLKLTDFGFARELEPEERLYSQFGTPEYVAPEVKKVLKSCLVLLCLVWRRCLCVPLALSAVCVFRWSLHRWLVLYVR